MPIISIIIPTYKPNELLYECLHSIDKQTFSKDKFEIIIILNGDKEPYYQLINKYISKFTLDIKLIYTGIKGVSNARNIGIIEASGNYLCFIDDDDMISPNYLENLYKFSGKDYIVVADFRTFINDINQLGYDYISKAFRTTKKNTLLCRRSFLSSSCGKLIHRDIIDNRIFNIKLKNSEDAVFMYNISNNIKKIELSSKDTIYYRRIRNTSASRKKRDLSYRVKNIINVCYSYITIFCEKPREYSFSLLLTRIAGTIIHNIH